MPERSVHQHLNRRLSPSHIHRTHPICKRRSKTRTTAHFTSTTTTPNRYLPFFSILSLPQDRPDYSLTRVLVSSRESPGPIHLGHHPTQPHSIVVYTQCHLSGLRQLTATLRPSPGPLTRLLRLVTRHKRRMTIILPALRM